MRSRTIVATLFILLCGAGSASAQALSLEFHDGLVRLKADNVPVTRILSEWTRIGGTRIVHGERVPGAPLTLEIADLPERQALEIVLRGAAGYMVLARETTPPGASSFDRILVLPTTARAPAAPPQPQPPPQPMPFPAESDLDDDANQAPFTPPPPGAFPRGRVPNVNRPQGGPPTQQPPQPLSPQQPPQDDDDPDEGAEPAPPPVGNPFGVVPGGARPGTISPAPPQQPNAGPQPNAGQPRSVPPPQQPNAGPQPR